jgi:cytoskeleton protein RodZ
MVDHPPKRKILFDEPADGDDALAAVARGEASVGEVLARVREEQELEVADVAAHLRIRESFLAALEAGDLAHLPGQAYAIGFVRSYAHFLGLDGEQAVQLFKIECQGGAAQAALVFPDPVAESRIPRGAILLISVLMAATAYGGWYYLTSRDMQLVDLVPHVPASLGGDAKVAGDTTQTTASVPAAASKSSESDGAAPTETSPDTATASMASKPAPATEVAAIAKPEPKPEPQPAPQLVPAIAEPASQPAPAATPAPEPAPQPETAAVPKPKPAPPLATAATPESAQAPAPAAQIAKTLAAIEIRAKADSWVQIRGTGGRVVMMRILRTGDSYKVPGEKGLTLMTGNAGAIEIMVDGTIVPAIGPFGAVRRDVALDPVRLKAGTAIAR